MFFAKIPRHTRQNAITEGDLECILTRNCEGTEQLRYSICFPAARMQPHLLLPHSGNLLHGTWESLLYNRSLP